MTMKAKIKVIKKSELESAQQSVTIEKKSKQETAH